MGSNYYPFGLSLSYSSCCCPIIFPRVLPCYTWTFLTSKCHTLLFSAQCLFGELEPSLPSCRAVWKYRINTIYYYLLYFCSLGKCSKKLFVFKFSLQCWVLDISIQPFVDPCTHKYKTGLHWGNK